MKGTAVQSTNSATTYEHLSAEEHRLELERTKDELRSVKKRLAERDAEILQLKTAHRKLQDALRKKDKDLQSVFSVLRAPQDAELTKKRKTELVERLLMETQQRVVNAEAVAEERKRELDKLKFSSKFLRFQELDVELEECYREIDHLRSQQSQFAVVGKLKISKKAVSAEGVKTPRTKPAPARDNEGNQRNAMIREQVVTPIVHRTVALETPVVRTESTRTTFVERTRRRAVEAEYQKQVRLAELEAECELEEKLRILAKREATAQAERRRQESQQNRRSSRRTERVDGEVEVPTMVPESVTGVPGTQENGRPTETLAETVAVKGAPTVVLESAAPLPDPRQDCTPTTVIAEALVVTAAVTTAQVETEVMSAGGDPPQEDVPAVVVDSREPKQYEEDDFDDAPAIEVPSIQNVNNEPKQRDEEHDEAVDENALGGESIKTVGDVVKPANAVDEYASTDEVDEPEAPEGEEEEAKDPLDDDVRDENAEVEEEEPPLVVPKQGFAVDPINRVEVPWKADAITERVETITDTPTQGFQVTVESTIAVIEESAETLQEDGEGEDEDSTAYDEVNGTATDVDCNGGGANEKENDATAHVDKIPGEGYSDEEDNVTTRDEGKPATTYADKRVNDEDIEPTAYYEDKPAIAHDGAKTINNEDQKGTTNDEENDVTSHDKCHDKTEVTEQEDEAKGATADEAVDNKTEGTEPENVTEPNEEIHDGNSVDKATDEIASRPPSPADTSPDDAPMAAVMADIKIEKNDKTSETLDACDDAIGAASELIHRQIDTALAEPIAPLDTKGSDLSPDDMAKAMDAAARKIQAFWRDMATKYATPRAPIPGPTETEENVGETVETPVESEHETTETPERIESPVASEAGDEEDNGW